MYYIPFISIYLFHFCKWHFFVSPSQLCIYFISFLSMWYFLLHCCARYPSWNSIVILCLIYTTFVHCLFNKFFFLISQLFMSFPNMTFSLFSFLILYLSHIISVQHFFLLLILNSTSLVLYIVLSTEFFLFFILNSTSVWFYCHVWYFSYFSFLNIYSSYSISVHNISLTFYSER